MIKSFCIYPMILYINFLLIFDVQIHAQSLINLAYGLPRVREIIPSNSTIYKINNILYIIQRETSSGRFTNLGVSMTPAPDVGGGVGQGLG